jgi:hypothetical protein
VPGSRRLSRLEGPRHRAVVAAHLVAVGRAEDRREFVRAGGERHREPHDRRVGLDGDRLKVAVPLSVVKMKSVFSAMPSSTSSFRVAPPLSSIFVIMPKKPAVGRSSSSQISSSFGASGPTA